MSQELFEHVDGRHDWLLAQLSETRSISTNAAAVELGVSVDTIRRDLRHLNERGLLRRVHGGAVPVSKLPSSFADRQLGQSPDRARLARSVVDRFRAGQLIGLDAGSTTAQIAAMIPDTLEITVVTNNPAAAVALGGHPSVEVILLGGVVDLNWMATTGAEVVDGWRSYRLDLGIVGVCGFDTSYGATTENRAEVATKRALIAAAGEVIAPVEGEKFDTQAPFLIAPVDAIDVVIS